MFCRNCGATLREGAKFCPECGLSTETILPETIPPETILPETILPEAIPPEAVSAYGSPSVPPAGEYRYETTTNLFPWNAVVPLVLLAWLPMTAIGVFVTIAEGFWFVPMIMSGIVLLAVFLIAWGYKGKQKKWGKDRTLWIIAPDGWAAGYPPDVARRLAALGAISAMATSGRMNWSVTSAGINMAEGAAKAIKGLPLNPWQLFIKAEYRPDKHYITLYTPTGQSRRILANPDNYTHVEQLVREYITITI